MSWVWEETDPSRSGTAGDLARLFRHESTKNPGALSLGAPEADATLVAREVIQNSSDAAMALRAKYGDRAPQFDMIFEFSSLAGDEKSQLVEALGLRQLASRVDAVDDRRQLGLGASDSLGEIDDVKPLRVLTITEHGTTGMPGPWRGAKSNMYLALVSLGYTVKADGSGGSYGFGKAGLIRGSAIRTVVAYSSFGEHVEDPDVTRRLLGMTYWGQHDVGEDSFTGFARFGDRQEAKPADVRPLENGHADLMAESLGLDLRTTDSLHDLGTTFLLIQPTIDTSQLLTAIERNWWPAIEDDLINVSVRDLDGVEHFPRPRQDPVLRSFIGAYDLAKMKPDNTKSTQQRTEYSTRMVEGEPTPPLGVLGLTVELEGWSHPDRASALVADGEEAAQVDHRSLVALIRSPRMVIEYLQSGVTSPFVRGVFVASIEADETLRRTEPKAHDAWQTSAGDENADPRATAIARELINKIKRDVNNFRNKHKATVVSEDDFRLPEFSKIMNRLLRGSSTGNPPPPPDSRPVSIRITQDVFAAEVGLVAMHGKAKLAIAENHDTDHSEADIAITYRFVEDGRAGRKAKLKFRCPTGVEPVGETSDGKFRAMLSKDKPVSISFETDGYLPDWTGRLVVQADLVAPDETPEAEE